MIDKLTKSIAGVSAALVTKDRTCPDCGGKIVTDGYYECQDCDIVWTTEGEQEQ